MYHLVWVLWNWIERKSILHFNCLLFFILKVVRGGDGMAGFAVRNPAGQIVKPYQWQATADYTDQVSPGGYYSVCIDNQFSRFAGKLVNIYITVVKYDAWDKYAKEIEELQLNMENFTVSSRIIWNSVVCCLLIWFYLNSSRQQLEPWNVISMICLPINITVEIVKLSIMLWLLIIIHIYRRFLFVKFLSLSLHVLSK